MQAILRAPVDLLWNGGIGTYVKASTETQRRRRRQGQRRDPGRRRRAARARSSARAATSASPSSAGSSARAHGGRHQHRRHRQLGRRRHLRPRGQHQDPARPGRSRAGDLTAQAAQRAAGRDDRRGRRAGAARQLRAERRCSATRARRPHSMLPVHQRLIRDAGARAASSTARSSSCRPTREIDARLAAGRRADLAGVRGAGRLRRRSTLEHELLDDRAARRAVVPARRCAGYFPPPLRERFADRLDGHPLRREIITTVVVNDMVNRGGITFVFRAVEETGADAGRGRARVRGGARGVRPADVLGAGRGAGQPWCRPTAQTRAATSSAGGCSTGRPAGCCRPRAPLSTSPAEIERLRGRCRALLPQIPDMLRGVERERLQRRTAELVDAGRAGGPGRARPRRCSTRFGLLDVVELAQRTGEPAERGRRGSTSRCPSASRSTSC